MPDMNFPLMCMFLVAWCISVQTWMAVGKGVVASKEDVKSSKFPWLHFKQPTSTHEGVVASKEDVKSSKFPWLHFKEPTSTRDDSGYRRCKSRRDCSKDECCVFQKGKYYKVCVKMLLPKERCDPYAIPGLSGMCPCTSGFTCALTSLGHRGKKAVHQCITAVYQQDEQD